MRPGGSFRRAGKQSRANAIPCPVGHTSLRRVSWYFTLVRRHSSHFLRSRMIALARRFTLCRLGIRTRFFSCPFSVAEKHPHALALLFPDQTANRWLVGGENVRVKGR